MVAIPDSVRDYIAGFFKANPEAVDTLQRATVELSFVGQALKELHVPYEQRSASADAQGRLLQTWMQFHRQLLQSVREDGLHPEHGDKVRLATMIARCTGALRSAAPAAAAGAQQQQQFAVDAALTCLAALSSAAQAEAAQAEAVHRAQLLRAAMYINLLLASLTLAYVVVRRVGSWACGARVASLLGASLAAGGRRVSGLVARQVALMRGLLRQIFLFGAKARSSGTPVRVAAPSSRRAASRKGGSGGGRKLPPSPAGRRPVVA